MRTDSRCRPLPRRHRIEQPARQHLGGGAAVGVGEHAHAGAFGEVGQVAGERAPAGAVAGVSVERAPRGAPVDDQAPALWVDPVGDGQRAGADVLVTATASDDSGLLSVVLSYRAAGSEEDFTTATMGAAGGAGLVLVVMVAKTSTKSQRQCALYTTLPV